MPFLYYWVTKQNAIANLDLLFNSLLIVVVLLMFLGSLELLPGMLLDF